MQGSPGKGLHRWGQKQGKIPPRESTHSKTGAQACIHTNVGAKYNRGIHTEHAAGFPEVLTHYLHFLFVSVYLRGGISSRRERSVIFCVTVIVTSLAICQVGESADSCPGWELDPVIIMKEMDGQRA